MIKSVVNEKNRRLKENLLFSTNLKNLSKSRNDDLLLRNLRGPLPILSTKNADVHLGGKGVQREKA